MQANSTCPSCNEFVRAHFSTYTLDWKKKKGRRNFEEPEPAAANKNNDVHKIFKIKFIKKSQYMPMEWISTVDSSNRHKCITATWSAKIVFNSTTTNKFVALWYLWWTLLSSIWPPGFDVTFAIKLELLRSIYNAPRTSI